MNPEDDLNESTAVGLANTRRAALLADGVPERRPLIGPHDATGNVKGLAAQALLLLAAGGPAEQVFKAGHLADLRAKAAGLTTDLQTFYGAWLRLRNVEVASPADYKEITEALRLWDARLFPWAWAALHLNPLVKPILLDIRKGTGPRDDADDVNRLVLLILAHWASFGASLPFTREELVEAAALATRFLAMDRSLPITPEDRLLRDRAFGVLSANFNAVRLAVIYLTQDEDQPRLAGR